MRSGIWIIAAGMVVAESGSAQTTMPIERELAGEGGVVVALQPALVLGGFRANARTPKGVAPSPQHAFSHDTNADRTRSELRLESTLRGWLRGVATDTATFPPESLLNQEGVTRASRVRFRDGAVFLEGGARFPAEAAPERRSLD